MILICKKYKYKFLNFFESCRWFYNRVVSRKSQEIDQSQSNVKRIVDYDNFLRLITLTTYDSIVESACVMLVRKII